MFSASIDPGLFYPHHCQNLLISFLKYRFKLFLGAISSYPLYFLLRKLQPKLRFSQQEDAAAIWARAQNTKVPLF
jgi:hypothetical protein